MRAGAVEGGAQVKAGTAPAAGCARELTGAPVGLVALHLALALADDAVAVHALLVLRRRLVGEPKTHHGNWVLLSLLDFLDEARVA